MSLFDLLTQKQPQFQTCQALIVVGLQNDFISPAGKLPVSNADGLIERVRKLVPVFRDNAGKVIWVRTELDPKRPVDDADDADAVVANLPTEEEASSDDGAGAGPQTKQRRARSLLKRISVRKQKEEAKDLPVPDKEDELFLTKSAALHVCLKGSPGAAWADSIAASIDDKADIVVTKSRYSAFKSNNLLLTLRAKLITELYVCGCISNISVYATAAEAARHGITIYLIDDCLGYRRPERHAKAVRQMVELFGAHTASSTDLIKQLQEPSEKGHGSSAEGAGLEDGLRKKLKGLSLQDESKPHRSSSSSTRHKQKSPSTGSNRTSTPRTDLIAPSSGPLEVKDDDDDELDEELPILARHLSSLSTRSAMSTRSNIDAASEAANGNGAVKHPRIRMRRRPGSSKKSSVDSSSNRRKDSDKTKSETTKEQQAEASSPKPSTSRTDSSQSPNPVASASSPPNGPTSESAGAADNTGSSQPPEKSQPVVQSPKNPEATAKSPKKPEPVAKPPPAHKSIPSLATLPTLGPDDKIGSGDSRIIYDLLPPTLSTPSDPSKPLADTVFQKLYNEVHWQKMLHATGEVPRLVCVQGAVARDGSMPLYRHPSDQILPLLHFTPTVQLVRKRVEELLGHEVNHVLIQLYRDGGDYISEHSDKTLDIARGSSIANASFGAQRTMRLRTKRDARDKEQAGSSTAAVNPERKAEVEAPTSAAAEAGPEPASERTTQRAQLCHNSLFVLGPATNAAWLHGIQPDKRRTAERSAAEEACAGMRISLTFRRVATFLSGDGTRLWGQGGCGKSRAEAGRVVSGTEGAGADEVKKGLLMAFGRENQSTKFDWEEVYGTGFDVLNLGPAPKELPMLFPGAGTGARDESKDLETRILTRCLERLGVEFTLMEAAAPAVESVGGLAREVMFRDADVRHTEVRGVGAVVGYLGRVYGARQERHGRRGRGMSGKEEGKEEGGEDKDEGEDEELEEQVRHAAAAVEYTALWHVSSVLHALESLPLSSASASSSPPPPSPSHPTPAQQPSSPPQHLHQTLANLAAFLSSLRLEQSPSPSPSTPENVRGNGDANGGQQPRPSDPTSALMAPLSSALDTLLEEVGARFPALDLAG